MAEAKNYIYMSKNSKLGSHISIMAAIIALGACASDGGGLSAGPLSPAVGAGDPPAAPRNANLTALSIGNLSNNGAVDENFDVSATFLTVRENAAGGDELVARSRTDFRDPGGNVSFDASSNTLTFNIQQGSVNIANEVFGPILLNDPVDFPNLTNDDLAVFLASVPETFFELNPSSVSENISDFSQLQNNLEAADNFINEVVATASNTINLMVSPGAQLSLEVNNRTVPDLIADVFNNVATAQSVADFLGPEVSVAQVEQNVLALTAQNFLASANGIAAEIRQGDFIAHLGSNGSVFFPLNLRANNSGVETNFVTLGLWETTPVNGTENDVTFGSTVFGSLTPADEVPVTGTATYNTTIGGFVLRNAVTEELRGGITINADFGTRLIDFFVDSDIATTNFDGTTLFTPFATLSGEGLLTGGNRFDGSLIGTTDTTLRGAIDGAFFGPRAVEIGGSFTFGNDNVSAAGSFVGVDTSADVAN